MNPTERIQAIINDSVLLKPEREALLAAVTQGANEEELTAIAELFEKNPWVVPILHINASAKMIAIAKHDTDALEKILEQEKAMIELVK